MQARRRKLPSTGKKTALLQESHLAWWWGRAVQPTPEEGAQCLSNESLRAAGVGERRRAPEGLHHGQNGFVHFYQNKSGSAAGTSPGNTEQHVDMRIDEKYPQPTPTNTFSIPKKTSPIDIVEAASLRRNHQLSVIDLYEVSHQGREGEM